MNDGDIVKKKILFFTLVVIVIFGFNISKAFALDNTNQSMILTITKVSCGNITDIPKKIPYLTSLVVTIIQIAVPIILVILGMIDLMKGVTAQKEDEIKKGQQIFIKRLIAGIIVFFIIVVVKFLISLIADTKTSDIVDCIDCFTSNDC